MTCVYAQLIVAGTINGTGVIAANGGDVAVLAGGAGGGGCVSVTHAGLSGVTVRVS
jgi:hypothetical protein